ncbi:MAG: glycosyl hydrolase-related protein [Gemmiger formicilis]|uniref:glycosyl hydrolase-related protein n=1 Tax=Gemmiger formicilis TaxID=745368 RepID=UPI0039A0FF8E
MAAQPAGTLPAAYSQFRVDAPNVVLETVKKAEDGSSLILRLYELGHPHPRGAGLAG